MPFRCSERSGQGLTPQQLVGGTCLVPFPLCSNSSITKLNGCYKLNRRRAENPGVSGSYAEQGRHRGRGCPPHPGPTRLRFCCA